MSRKSNTVWFMLLAIVFNLVLMLIMMLLGYVLLAFLYKDVAEPGPGITILMFLIFIVAIGLSWFLYSKIVQNLIKKHGLEDKISPELLKYRPKKKKHKDNNFVIKG